MKRKSAQRKPKVSPGTAAAATLAALRWRKTTADERRELMRAVAAQHTPETRWRSDKPKCPCGRMTLKRAEARGRTWEHEAGCKFHPMTDVAVSADTKRTNGDKSVADRPQAMPKIWREKPR